MSERKREREEWDGSDLASEDQIADTTQICCDLALAAASLCLIALQTLLHKACFVALTVLWNHTHTTTPTTNSTILAGGWVTNYSAWIHLFTSKPRCIGRAWSSLAGAKDIIESLARTHWAWYFGPGVGIAELTLELRGRLVEAAPLPRSRHPLKDEWGWHKLTWHLPQCCYRRGAHSILRYRWENNRVADTT